MPAVCELQAESLQENKDSQYMSIFHGIFGNYILCEYFYGRTEKSGKMRFP